MGFFGEAGKKYGVFRRSRKKYGVLQPPEKKIWTFQIEVSYVFRLDEYLNRTQEQIIFLIRCRGYIALV